MSQSASYRRSKHKQFRLNDLFVFMTLCCLLAAASNPVGIVPAFCLMVFSLVLALDWGPAALAILVVASLAADPPRGYGEGASLFPQFMTTTLAAGIAFWRLRQRNRFAPFRSCLTGTAATVATGSRTDHS